MMLKNLLMAMVMFLSVSAFGEIQKISKGSTGISPLKGEITDVQPLCPEGMTCYTNGTVVTVKYYLNGCLDTMVDGGVVAIEDGSDLNIVTSAFNIHHKKSEVTLCFAAPTVTKKYQFVNQFGNVQMKHLQVR